VKLIALALHPPAVFLGSIVPMSDRTVYSLVEAAAKTWGTNPALLQPTGGKGEDKYQIYNWIEYRQAVEEIAVGLNRLGVRKGDIVTLNADTRAEFYLSDIGIMTAGGIAAAVYTSYPAANLVDTIRECEARVAFAENPAMMSALREAAGDQHLDVQWILLEGEAEDAITLDQLREKGATAIIDDPELLPQICGDISPDDPAILYLTSGATGAPKMGLASHGSIVSNVNMGPKVIDIGPDDATIAFLPSAHITQRIAMQMIPLRMGVPVWFSAGLSKLPNELKAVAPTFFVAPPRVWERIYASICTEIRKRGGLSRKLFYWALGLGLEAVRRKQSGRAIPAWLTQSLKIADKLVYSKIKARFGGRLRLAVSGAAPLGKELADFYATIGMPIHEGYGLTEGGIVCLNPLGAPRSGSIGNALPGVEMKLAEDGELLIKSETLFSGYYKDDSATAEVLRDGCLYTGDIARIDEEGFVYITGRKKEVLVASNGKKIYPSSIENLFKMEPLINQVLLLGDKMPYAAALLTINPAAVESLPGMSGASKKPMEELVGADVIQKEVKQIVARVNAKLADFEKIRRYQILGRDFTIADGELTPTMKLRRTQVIKNHDAIIQTLYKGQGPTSA
jgi:long-chain acyl-CoA synthetase